MSSSSASHPGYLISLIFNSSQPLMTWQRTAGALSCASCIFSGAYGSHGLKRRNSTTDVQVKQWEVANKYQFLHSIILLALPTIVPAPQQLCLRLSSFCFASGTALFSGGIYGKVLTEDENIGKASPVGGILMSMGWVSLALLRR